MKSGANVVLSVTQISVFLSYKSHKIHNKVITISKYQAIVVVYNIS